MNYVIYIEKRKRNKKALYTLYLQLAAFHYINDGVLILGPGSHILAGIYERIHGTT